MLKWKFHPCTEATDGICPHRFEKDANTAFRLFQRNKYDEVSYYSNKAIGEGERIGEDVTWLHYLNAQIAAAQGHYDAAASEMSINGVIIGDFSLYNHGVYALKSGDYFTALDAFDNHIMVSNDLLHESQWGKGIAYLKLNMPDSALHSFSAALLVRDNPEVRLGIINALIQTGKRLAALDYCRSSVRKFPLHQKLREALKNILSNQASNVFHHFYTSLLSAMTITQLDMNRANRAFNHGDYDKANRIYKNIVRKHPGDLEANLGIVNVLLAQNKYDEARAKLNTLITVTPSDTRLHEAMGLLDYVENRWDSALVHLQKADTNPQSPMTYDGYLAAGTILYSRNFIMPAYLLFEKACRRNNENSWAHAGMAMCLLSRYDFQYRAALRSEARIHLIVARLKAPADPVLLMYSGLTEYYSGHDALSRHYFSKAAENGSHDAYMYNAWALLEGKEGNYEKAFTLMDKARSLAPDNAILFLNSGMLQMKYAAMQTESDSSNDVSPYIRRMHLFYDTALVLGLDSNVINVNRGVAYAETGIFDTAIIWFSRVSSADTLVTVGSINNSGVVFALTGNKGEATDAFYEAKAIDASNNYDFVDGNIRTMNSVNRGNVRKKYTYVFFYAIPVAPFRPDLEGTCHLPDAIPCPDMPHEVQETHYYNVSCNAYHSLEVIRIKGEKRRKEKIRKTKIDACW